MLTVPILSMRLVSLSIRGRIKEKTTCNQWKPVSRRTSSGKPPHNQKKSALDAAEITSHM